MTGNEVIPAFLVAYPSIDAAWRQHLEFWGDESDRGLFNDAGVVAHHLVDCFERGNLSEFPMAFSALERCLVEGDDQARELATIGVIEAIQNIASYRSFGAHAFYGWLGPEARGAWDELYRFWGRVMEAKAAGLLDPLDGPPAMPVTPSQIENPSRRRMMEQIYRAGDETSG